jgi:hypothetical protein
LAVLEFKPNVVRKGEGTKSKAKSPDPHDGYPFETKSFSYARIISMGYVGATLVQVVRIGSLIERHMRDVRIHLSRRNRAARRRKANAFHWLDENMPKIGLMLFDRTVFAVLGVRPMADRRKQ